MMNPLLPKKLSERLSEFARSDSHAMSIIGAQAAVLAGSIVQAINDTQQHTVTKLEPEEKKVITIEQVRHLKQSFALKQSSKQPRLIIVPNAELLGVDAQNSLLKLLEEPPAHVRFVLIASSKDALLPTIISRTALAQVGRIDQASGLEYYKKQSIEESVYTKAFMIAAGDPGKLFILLSNPNAPYFDAIESAKTLLASSAFERVAKAEEYGKNKETFILTLKALDDVLRALCGSSRSTSSQLVRMTSQRKLVHGALNSLDSNVNTKIVALDVLLAL